MHLWRIPLLLILQFVIVYWSKMTLGVALQQVVPIVAVVVVQVVIVIVVVDVVVRIVVGIVVVVEGIQNLLFGSC